LGGQTGEVLVFSSFKDKTNKQILAYITGYNTMDRELKYLMLKTRGFSSDVLFEVSMMTNDV